MVFDRWSSSNGSQLQLVTMLPASVSYRITKSYHIMNAVRSTTTFGQSLMVTMKDDTNKTVRVFLPKRYIHVFTDEDINSTN